jgi:hypothetical protein
MKNDKLTLLIKYGYNVRLMRALRSKNRGVFMFFGVKTFSCLGGGIKFSGEMNEITISIQL